jgi:translation initiation factor IF-2
MRVYEIAKEVGIPNKELLAKIRSLGLEVNNHMSSLNADDVVRIKKSLEKDKAGTVAPGRDPEGQPDRRGHPSPVGQARGRGPPRRRRRSRSPRRLRRSRRR